MPVHRCPARRAHAARRSTPRRAARRRLGHRAPLAALPVEPRASTRVSSTRSPPRRRRRPSSGEFVVWVDPLLADAWGALRPRRSRPRGSRSPNWVIPDFDIPRDGDSDRRSSWETSTIPDAAFIHGQWSIRRNPVEGSALRSTNGPDTTTSLCDMRWPVTPPRTATIGRPRPGRTVGESDWPCGIVRLD